MNAVHLQLQRIHLLVFLHRLLAARIARFTLCSIEQTIWLAVLFFSVLQCQWLRSGILFTKQCTSTASNNFTLSSKAIHGILKYSNTISFFSFFYYQTAVFVWANFKISTHKHKWSSTVLAHNLSRIHCYIYVPFPFFFSY